MTRLHRLLAIAAATLGLGAAATDYRPSVNVPGERDQISAVALAERIISREPNLRIFDLRSLEEYDQFHIPGSKHAVMTDLTRDSVSPDSTVVLYSEDGPRTTQAWILMRMRGYRNVFFLREGIYEWISRVHEPRLAIDATAAERADFERAAELSRFFGGLPLADVPRPEVSTKETIAKIRRRGC